MTDRLFMSGFRRFGAVLELATVGEGDALRRRDPLPARVGHRRLPTPTRRYLPERHERLDDVGRRQIWQQVP